MTILRLPVTNDGARNFTTSINGENFRFRTYFNRLDGWYIDIFDDLENVIIEGVALNTGIDLLRQHTGNDFGHELYYVTSDGSSGVGEDDLGTLGYPQVVTSA